MWSQDIAGVRIRFLKEEEEMNQIQEARGTALKSHSRNQLQQQE